MVAILMMSAKLATLGLLKIKLFQNKGYDVISPVLSIVFKFYTSVTKELKLSFWGLIPMIVEVAGEKLVRKGPFFPPL